MSEQYSSLANRYDSFTADVPYQDFLSYYINIFSKSSRPVRTILDLCCGTGTISLCLAEKGYEMISVDASPDMLSVFQQKLPELSKKAIAPMLLCQPAQELDLYDTVDAVICTLDGINYIPPEVLPEVFRRVKLFLNPQGIFVFDILSPEHMEALHGQCFVDETEDCLCLWRANVQNGVLEYGMDIFNRTKQNQWSRQQEEHKEYIHSTDTIFKLLSDAGFTNLQMDLHGPQADQGRIFITGLGE